MATIWKFPIPIENDFTIVMPRDPEFLFVAVQDGQPCLWARVVPERHKEERHFKLRGTGHPISTAGKHIGSFMLRDGTLVFHLFDDQPE